jgi:hypothetical protein
MILLGEHGHRSVTAASGSSFRLPRGRVIHVSRMLQDLIAVETAEANVAVGRFKSSPTESLWSSRVFAQRRLAFHEKP